MDGKRPHTYDTFTSGFPTVRLFPFFALTFLIVPIVEIYVLIKVGGWIGPVPTVALVVLTAVVGAFLLRQQGFATMMRLQSTMARGQLPALELMEGAVLLVGGAMLLTPGFVTDAIGFVCLIPFTRRALVKWLTRRAIVHVQTVHTHSRPGHRTYEGEYREVGEADRKIDRDPPGPS